MRRMCLIPVLALAACAADQPTPQQARGAMVERMESSGRFRVKVREIHALDLSACVRATDAEGVVCQVAMDVSFESDGALQRSNDTGPMRFVREAGGWKAYWEESATPR